VAGDGLVEGLAESEAAEVEGRSPTVLVEISGQVVVAGEELVRNCARRESGGTYCRVKVAYSLRRA
jgi:hypothetical protein